MNTPTQILRRGILLVLALATIREISAGLITSGPIEWGSVAVDSVWKRELSNEYLPSPGVIIGQEHSGFDPYNLYRAYLVFELPKFKGLHTPESLGLTPEQLGDHNLFTTKATGATLHLENLGLGAFPYSDLTVELRQAPLNADELVAGNIDLETVFKKLNDGTVWAKPVIPFTQAEDFIFPYYALSMNGAFTDYLNSRNGGQFVVSFTLPFIPETRDFGDTYHLIGMEPHAYLETQMDFFEPAFSPVPEPATYGMVAAVGLASLAFWRRRRQAIAR